MAYQPKYNNVVSTENSTTTPLSAGGIFTGIGVDVSVYNSLVVSAKTDKTGKLYVDFSPDNINWDSTLTFDIAANVNEVHRITITRKYFRVRIENTSGVSQTFLRSQAILGSHEVLTSSLNSTLYPDADGVVSRSVLTGATDGGGYKNVPVTPEGHLEVAIHSPINPFGSLRVESNKIIFQGDAVYGLNPTSQLTTTSLGGSAFSVNNFFICKTGTSIGGSGTIQSRRRLRYRPGQGAICRFTAIWDTPVSNSIIVAGVGSGESGYFLALSGTTFGILESNYGARQIMTLTITTPSTSTSSYNVTLNGTTTNVTATNNNNAFRTAYEISQGVYPGWTAEAVGNTVIFLAGESGLKSGSFSLSQSGAGTPSAGTFITTVSGKSTEDKFIPQSSWNGDKLDGTGSSGITINPQLGNIFEIDITYLGFGPITFRAFMTLNDNNPEWITIHTINNPNALTRTNMSQPSFPFTMAAYSAGSTTNVGLSCASYCGMIEGEHAFVGPKQSFSRVAASAVGSADGIYYNLFTVRNGATYKNRANQSVIYIKHISVAHGDNTPMVMYLIRDATLLGNPNFISHSNDSCTFVDYSATTCTIANNNQIVESIPVGSTSSGGLNFENGYISIQPGETVTLAARTVTGTSPYTIGAINVSEEQ